MEPLFHGRPILTIPVSTIRPGPQYFLPRLDRDQVARDWIAHYREQIRSGVVLDPIVLDARKFIVDGHHRWRAHVLEKKETIRVIVSPTGGWPI
jgi:ParB-like chromosome segregation protein Spo0J